MALEYANYVNQLVQTNPVGSTDYLSEGDKHIKLVKRVIQQSFPNFNSPLNVEPLQWNAIHDTLKINLNSLDFDGYKVINFVSSSSNKGILRTLDNDGRYIRPNDVLDSNITMNNDESIQFKTNSPVNAIKMDRYNTIQVGDENTDLEIRGSKIKFDGKVLLQGSSILQKVYPVGSVYTNAIDTRNPAHEDLLGFGVWAKHAEGRVDVCRSNEPEFIAMNQIGGSKAHSLTEKEMPAHTHSFRWINDAVGAEQDGMLRMYGGYLNGGTLAFDSTGKGTPHNNTMPYIVVQKWKRVA